MEYLRENTRKLYKIIFQKNMTFTYEENVKKICDELKGGSGKCENDTP